MRRDGPALQSLLVGLALAIACLPFQARSASADTVRFTVDFPSEIPSDGTRAPGWLYFTAPYRNIVGVSIVAAGGPPYRPSAGFQGAAQGTIPFTVGCNAPGEHTLVVTVYASTAAETRVRSHRYQCTRARQPAIRIIMLDAYTFPPRTTIYGRLSFYAPDRNVSRVVFQSSDGDFARANIPSAAMGKDVGTFSIPVQCNGLRAGLVTRDYWLETQNGVASAPYQLGFTCSAASAPAPRPRTGRTPAQITAVKLGGPSKTITQGTAVIGRVYFTDPDGVVSAIQIVAVAGAGAAGVAPTYADVRGAHDSYYGYPFSITCKINGAVTLEFTPADQNAIRAGNPFRFNFFCFGAR